MVKTLSNRWVGAFATGAMALASFAPMAHAGHHEGNGPKYKRVIYDDRGWGNWGNWNNWLKWNDWNNWNDWHNWHDWSNWGKFSNY